MVLLKDSCPKCGASFSMAADNHNDAKAQNAFRAMVQKHDKDKHGTVEERNREALVASHTLLASVVDGARITRGDARKVVAMLADLLKLPRPVVSPATPELDDKPIVSE